MTNAYEDTDDRSFSPCRTTRIAFACSVLTTLLIAPSPAGAQESPAAEADRAASEPVKPEPAAGGRGRVVFDLFAGESGLGGYNMFVAFFGGLTVRRSSDTRVDTFGRRTSNTVTALGVAPSFDVFVTDRLSLGGEVSASWLSTSATLETPPGAATPISAQGESHGYALGAAPRIGYAFPLSDSWAIWPRVSFTAQHARQDFDNTGRSVARTFGTDANLGIVHRVSKHALFEFGPLLAYRVRSVDGSMGSGSLGATSLLSASEQSSALSGGVRASLRLVF